MSSPKNPLVYTPRAEVAPSPLLPPPPPAPEENPPWNGWDVIALSIVAILSIILFLLVTTFAAQMVLFPRIPVVDVARFPLVTMVAQMLAYLAMLAFMRMLAKRGHDEPFWKVVHWNWPQSWFVYLLAGVMLSIALQLLAHLLPMPKELPIDRFFQTATQAWALSFFGITIAPLLEELFFRGFLYPVLARRAGTAVAVIFTSIGFGVIHAPQLAQAWAPVLIVFLVGLVLTITRAITKSVAPGFLIHVAYNGTISVLLFVASGGFRHLEKLNQ